MAVYFIGCLHLGHNSIAEYRGFKDSDEYFEKLKLNWNETVNKRDKVFILGDITMEKSKHYHLLNQLNGHKEVILGNHDLPKHVPEMLNYVDKVSGAVKYRNYILTHIPIHTSEVDRFICNVHAHIHDNVIEDCRYFNVDANVLHLKPISFEEISYIVERKNSNLNG